MPDSVDTFSQDNACLAKACQLAAASCCKKGKIFLPGNELQRIRDWIRANNPGELHEFESRLEDLGDFSLYDQQHSCQFLDSQNYCRLHMDGVKPSECFWWPLHVYEAESGDLEIRVSRTCCEGFKFIKKSSPHVAVVKEQAVKIGADLIKKFRAIYKGSYGTEFIDRLDQ